MAVLLGGQFARPFKTDPGNLKSISKVMSQDQDIEERHFCFGGYPPPLQFFHNSTFTVLSSRQKAAPSLFLFASVI
jgi:hypothetical protein